MGCRDTSREAVPRVGYPIRSCTGLTYSPWLAPRFVPASETRHSHSNSLRFHSFLKKHFCLPRLHSRVVHRPFPAVAQLTFLLVLIAKLPLLCENLHQEIRIALPSEHRISDRQHPSILNSTPHLHPILPQSWRLGTATVTGWGRSPPRAPPSPTMAARPDAARAAFRP